MHRNISTSKYISKTLLLGTVLLFIAGFNPSDAQGEEAPNITAFTIRGSNQEYGISQEVLNAWKTPRTNSEAVAYTFGPIVNLDIYVAENLGVKSFNRSRLHFEDYNLAEIYSYIRTLRAGIDKDPQDAIFEVGSDGKVSNFNPGSTGNTLDIRSSINSIVEALSNNSQDAALVISETQPNRLLSQTNSLGIIEHLASGSSDFKGSPANRIHNIKVGVQKESGVLIAPGEEFSFNKYLGEVDGANGFLPELVIKKTGTVPEFGGGLCQVSSTVFRAAMNGGFPIIERRNHSYAVQYYAPQGTDATIYPGVVDFRFKNNTSGYILIWPTYPQSHTLQFDIYGTKDSRQIAVGTPYQYDKKSNGAMKATWTRTVTMPNGEVLQDEFKSIYQPPALFHKVETYPEKPTEQPVEQPAPTPPDTSFPNNSNTPTI